tara:strand:- start:532 stop:834 length:303 start_codon:yes stop_codon:yes gene_type:complete
MNITFRNINTIMDKDLIRKTQEILETSNLDLEQQEFLKEISLGKISTTVLVGRLKLLTNKIKDIKLRKVFMGLGYMIYVVSLQQKSLDEINKKLDRLDNK